MARNKRRRSNVEIVEELREFHHYEAADRMVHLASDIEKLLDRIEELELGSPT